MEYHGICHKMKAYVGDTVETDAGELAASVEYKLILDPFECDLMPFLGRQLQITWLGEIACVACGNRTPKSYAQGHCYSCLISKASCDMCMMKPETCHFDAGTCREPDWALSFCFKPHVVYLANASGIKVGITRHTQIPTRWLDQGATQALPILQTQNRKLVGLVEVLLAQTVADKTNWRAMLKGEATSLDLIALRDELLVTHQDELAALMQQYPNEITLLSDAHLRTFVYPVTEYPAKVTSHNLDKTPSIAGILLGIKGQYLILDTGVINLRKYSGYRLTVRG